MSNLPLQSSGIARYSVYVPRFVTDEDFGFGDVIKRVASSAGFKPCGGCQHRTAALNQWLVFSSRPPK